MKKQSVANFTKIIFWIFFCLSLSEAKNEDGKRSLFFSWMCPISLGRFVDARKNYLHVKPCLPNYVAVTLLSNYLQRRILFRVIFIAWEKKRREQDSSKPRFIETKIHRNQDSSKPQFVEAAVRRNYNLLKLKFINAVRELFLSYTKHSRLVGTMSYSYV